VEIGPKESRASWLGQNFSDGHRCVSILNCLTREVYRMLRVVT